MDIKFMTMTGTMNIRKAMMRLLLNMRRDERKCFPADAVRCTAHSIRRAVRTTPGAELPLV